MPIATIGVESDDFSFRIDSVDVAAVGRRQGSQFRLGCLPDICLSEIYTARESLGIDVGDGAGIGIERQYSLERGCLVDCPDYGIIRISVNATSASSAWYAKEELVRP